MDAIFVSPQGGAAVKPVSDYSQQISQGLLKGRAVPPWKSSPARSIPT